MESSDNSKRPSEAWDGYRASVDHVRLQRLRCCKAALRRRRRGIVYANAAVRRSKAIKELSLRIEPIPHDDMRLSSAEVASTTRRPEPRKEVSLLV